MSKEFRVYNIEEEIIINANHSPDNSVKYHVCYGAVDWRKNGKRRPAVFILMSYHGKKSYQTPAHLTFDFEDSEGNTDFEKVYEALTYLRMKYLVSKKYEIEVHKETVTAK